VQRAPARGRYRAVAQRGIHGCECLLDQFGGRMAARAFVPVQRHADEDAVGTEEAAERGKRVDGVREIVANAAQPSLSSAGHRSIRRRPGSRARSDESPLQPPQSASSRSRWLESAPGAGRACARECLHQFHEIRPVRRFAAGEIDPLKIRVCGGDGLHLVQRKLAVETAGGCLSPSRCRSRRSGSSSAW